MALKTAFITLALVALPALASAECSWSKHQAQSCAPGSVWDAQSESCVKQITS